MSKKDDMGSPWGSHLPKCVLEKIKIVKNRTPRVSGRSGEARSGGPRRLFALVANEESAKGAGEGRALTKAVEKPGLGAGFFLSFTVRNSQITRKTGRGDTERVEKPV